MNAEAEFLSFAFFLKTETVRVRGEKRKEKVAFIECSNLERAKTKKKRQVFFVRIIEILQCLYRSFFKMVCLCVLYQRA